METQGLIYPVLEADGKQVVVASPATQGWKTWLTGAGDQLDPLQRGDGPRLRLSFTEPDTKTVEVQFNEPVEIHDGHGDVKPAGSAAGCWGLDDYLDVYSRIPATPVSAGAGAGNANAQAIGGGAELYVPAPDADGDTTINLATAVPAPASANDGYWNTDYETGVTTPIAAGDLAAPNGNCNLFNFELKAFLMRRIQLGNTLGEVDIDTYKTEWFHPSWFLGLEVTKASAGVGEFGAWVLLFRQHVTES